nr:hypothetical protein [Tanacetum cinerariifolium]
MEIVGSVESMVEWMEEWEEESGIVGGKKSWGGTVGLKRGGKMVLFGNFYTISPCGYQGLILLVLKGFEVCKCKASAL